MTSFKMKLLCHSSKCNKVFKTGLSKYDQVLYRQCENCLDFMCSNKCMENHNCGFNEKEWNQIKQYYEVSK